MAICDTLFIDPINCRKTPREVHGTMRHLSPLALLGMLALTNGQKMGILYSTVGGNTEMEVKKLAKLTGLEPLDIGDITPEDVASYDHLIIGAPTWATGKKTHRSETPWDDFIFDELPKLDMKGKKVAIFGVGNMIDYPDNFCDWMDEAKRHFEAVGAEIIGKWPVDDSWAAKPAPYKFKVRFRASDQLGTSRECRRKRSQLPECARPPCEKERTSDA